jgi:hypothetical protein
MSNLSTFAFACVALIACTYDGHHTVHSSFSSAAPVPQSIVIVRTEVVHEHIADDKLVCPNDPVVPRSMTPKATGQYIAALTEVADQCRANLEVLRKGP